MHEKKKYNKRMFSEYLNFFIFVFFNFFISVLLLVLSIMFITQDSDIVKNSPYECGFQPFKFNIEEFDIKYYIIASLFLIFDLEIVFLLPLIMALNSISLVGFFSIFLFLFLLLLGFFYE